jgi:hypothetical protein
VSGALDVKPKSSKANSKRTLVAAPGSRRWEIVGASLSTCLWVSSLVKSRANFCSGVSVTIKHWYGRPPKNAIEVERLLNNGSWITDDGRSGLAFSGIHGVRKGSNFRFPAAWGPNCACSTSDKRCPFSQAMARTSRRYGGASNGALMCPTKK